MQNLLVTGFVGFIWISLWNYLLILSFTGNPRVPVHQSEAQDHGSASPQVPDQSPHQRVPWGQVGADLRNFSSFVP